MAITTTLMAGTPIMSTAIAGAKARTAPTAAMDTLGMSGRLITVATEILDMSGRLTTVMTMRTAPVIRLAGADTGAKTHGIIAVGISMITDARMEGERT